MKFVFTAFFLITTITNAKSQITDSIPFNHETNKISITQIVSKDSIKAQDLYNYIQDWQTLLKKYTIVMTKDEMADKEAYYIYSMLMQSQNISDKKDSYKLIYKVIFNNSKPSTNIGIGVVQNWKSGLEYADLILTIKDGKYKAELTNFRHTFGDTEHYADIAYENSKKHPGSEKKWDEFKKEQLYKYNIFVNSIDNYIKKHIESDKF